MNIVTQEIERLPQFLQEDEGYVKYLTSLLQPFQDIVDNLNAYPILDIDNSIGEQLDIIGYMLGVKRLGKIDDEYRKLLILYTSLRRSNPTLNFIQDSVYTLFEVNQIFFLEKGDATITVYANIKNNDVAVLHEILNGLKASGITIDLYYTDNEIIDLRYAVSGLIAVEDGILSAENNSIAYGGGLDDTLITDVSFIRPLSHETGFIAYEDGLIGVSQFDKYSNTI